MKRIVWILPVIALVLACQPENSQDVNPSAGPEASRDADPSAEPGESRDADPSVEPGGSSEEDVSQEPGVSEVPLYLLQGDPERGTVPIITDGKEFLVASRNGTFGERSDTVWVSSVGTEESLVFITDEQGEPVILFDGERVVFADADDESGEIAVLEYEDGSVTKLGTVEADMASRAGRVRKAPLPLVFTDEMLEHLGKSANKVSKIGCFFMFGSAVLEHLNRYEQFYENPNFRLVEIGVDIISSGVDLAALGLSGLAAGLSAGATAEEFSLNCLVFMNDISNLLDDLSPTLERRKAFEQYYIREYGISVTPLPAEDVTFTSAKLRGQVNTARKLNYTVSFTVYSPTEGRSFDVHASPGDEISAQATGLSPATDYYYWVNMSFKKHFLSYTVMAEDYEEFNTLSPSASTGDVVSVTEDSAEVECRFDAPPGVACGIRVDEDRFIPVPSTAETATITGLEVATDYNYAAYVYYGGQYHYGEKKTLQTALPDVTGTWSCTETHVSRYGVESKVSYSVTLNEDGTATYSEDGSFVGAKWYRTREQLFVEIVFMVSAHTGSDSGLDLTITFDDCKSANHGEGMATYWNYSNSVGTSSRNGYDLVMSR